MAYALSGMFIYQNLEAEEAIPFFWLAALMIILYIFVPFREMFKSFFKYNSAGSFEEYYDAEEFWYEN